MRSILEAFEVSHVSLVKTNDAASKLLKNKKYDCIFVDNMTNKENGLELTKYIRQSDDKSLRKTPIILCSALTEQKLILQARDVGITEILAKPVSPDQIMEKMSNALFNKRDFIISGEYLGPDRRRRIRDLDGTADRREQAIPLPKEVARDDTEGDT